LDQDQWEQAMNVKFLNPFVSAASEVLSLELHEVVERGELRLENGLYMTDDVTVIISLIGAVTGTVFFSMSNESALQLASTLMEEKLDILDKLAQSGIAELGNVIAGRASMKLAAAGYETNISTPSLILGSGATLSTLGYPRLVVPLQISNGAVTIHLALRAGDQAGLKSDQPAILKMSEPQIQD
jgi:chemotaxis protein CheX